MKTKVYTQNKALLEYIEQLEERNKELFSNVCKAFDTRNEGVKRDIQALKHNLKIGKWNETRKTKIHDIKSEVE